MNKQQLEAKKKELEQRYANVKTQMEQELFRLQGEYRFVVAEIEKLTPKKKEKKNDTTIQKSEAEKVPKDK